MTSHQKAYTYALIAVFFWSTAGSAFKLTLEHFHPYQLLLLASTISFLVLLVVYLWYNKFNINDLINFQSVKKSAIAGFLNPFLYYVILFHAYAMLPAQEAMALNYLWPVTLVLLSIPLLKQRISLLSMIAILISFSGTLIIGLRGDFSNFSISNPLGFSLALGSSIVWALYWILNVRDKREPLAKLVLNFAFGSIYTLVLLLLSTPTLTFAWQGFAGATYIGFFEMGFTFLFWLLALKHSDTTARVSNLIFLSPFLSLLLIRITVGEKILFSTLIGLGLIVTGVLMQHYFSGRTRHAA